MRPDPDHATCESERLAHLGAVQPQGGLLVCDPGAARVLAASVGVGAALGRDRDPRPGEPAAEWLPPPLRAALLALPPAPAPPVPMPGAPPGLECLAHRSPEGLVVEWVRPRGPAPAGTEEHLAALSAGIAVTLANPFLGAQALAQGVAALSGHDRVMVYRFHRDWSGEVIAEARDPALPPFLGLRYPASDIPAQARELYLRTTLRVVADVQDVALPVRHAGAEPPDLGLALLRSVSPLHIQYLRNMGVRATLTASLIHRGRLWGLIACHHGRPHLPPHPVRQAVAQAAALFSGLLDRVEEAAARRREAAVAALRAGPGSAPPGEMLARLLLRHDGLAGAADADGIAWVAEGQACAVGLAPDIPALRRLAAEAGPPGTLQATDRLGLPPAEDPRRVLPAGMLAAALPGGGWLALFRRELTQEIHWAGNPAKATGPGPQGQLSPRRSFALWREQVFGACRPWGEEERALLQAAVGLLAPLPRAPMAAALADQAGALARGDNAALQSLAELLAPHSTALLLQGTGAAARLADLTPALATLLGVSSTALRGRPWPEVAEALGIVALGPWSGEATEEERRQHLAFSPHHGPLTLRLGLESALRHAGMAPALEFDALVVEDETRHGRLSAALRAAGLQAERARRAREVLLRNAGHELLTPLHAILGFASLLAEPPAALPPTAARSYAREVLEAGRSMQGLVENLLAVSRLESGRLSPSLAPIDLCGLLREQAATLAPLFAAKPVRLRLDLPAAAPAVTDASLLGPALVNLLSNALKFTPANGEVACRLVLQPGRADIRVADDGPGIPPEARERIFQGFEQVDGSLARPQGGAGLGLYIARTMVELLGGSLALETPAGGGSVFVLRLPTEPPG